MLIIVLSGRDLIERKQFDEEGVSKNGKNGKGTGKVVDGWSRAGIVAELAKRELEEPKMAASGTG